MLGPSFPQRFVFLASEQEQKQLLRPSSSELSSQFLKCVWDKLNLERPSGDVIGLLRNLIPVGGSRAKLAV